MPARPPPPASDCPGSSNAPRQDVARSRARSPHLGAAAIDVAVVACSVPASPAYRSPRRPSTGQECRSWRTAGSKRREPYPAQVAGFISEWWPGSNRNGGRHQIGMPGRIASEFAKSKGGVDEIAIEIVDSQTPDAGVKSSFDPLGTMIGVP